MKNVSEKIRNLTAIGMMTAIICVLAPFSLAISGLVPISLGTLVIYFIPYILNIKNSLFCCLAYIILGAAGLPVFTGFTGGMQKIAGPTGGYMLGYFFVLICEGIAIKYFSDSRTFQALGMLLGTAFLYAFGTLWLSHLMGLSFMQGLMAGVIPFIPGDLCKMVLVLIAAPVICRRLQKAGLETALSV